MGEKQNIDIDEIKKLADEGDVESMYNYAELIYSGKGVKINKKLAAQYYQKASEKGDTKSTKEKKKSKESQPEKVIKSKQKKKEEAKADL